MKIRTKPMKCKEARSRKLSAFVHIVVLKPCDCDFNGQNPALICKTKKPSKHCKPVKDILVFKHANKMWCQAASRNGAK